MMDESFNPYLKWLGISLHDQPPNHYRLLGIPELIDDPDVIDHAANRQMGHIRTFATGQHSKLSQQLLNEIAAAKICLLSPEKKKAYDEQLRQTAAQKAAHSKSASTAAATRPVLHTRSLPQAAPLPTSQPAPLITDAQPVSVTQRLRKGNSPGMLAAVVLGLLLVAGIAIWLLSRSTPKEPAVAEQQPKIDNPVLPPVERATSGDPEGTTEPAATKTVELPTKVDAEKLPLPAEPTPDNSSTTKEDETAAASTEKRNTESTVKEPDTSDDTTTKQATGQSVDLLTEIDLKRDTVDGAWALERNELVSPASSQSNRLILPGVIPKEYSLTMEVERIQGENMLFVGLLVGGKQGELFLDWHARGKGFVSGFFPESSFPGYPNPIFKQGHISRIECVVTEKRVLIFVDGKIILDQSDRLNELAVNENWAISKQDVLYLGCYETSFRFTKVELTPIIDSSAAIAQAKERGSSSKTPGKLAANENLPLVKKLPLPGGPELETAQSTLREIFQEDLAAAKSPEQQSTLAKTFLNQVAGEKQSPAEAYVLLNAAKTMATKGADSEAAMAAVDKMAERFDIDSLEMKAKTLTELAKPAKTPAEQMALIMAIGEVVRELVEEDRFELAEPLTKLAQSAALKTGNIQLRKELAVSIKEFGEMLKAYRAVQPALEKLKQSPDDAVANLEVGRYLAFVKNDWPAGLKNLAVSSDETLRTLAIKDMAGTNDAAEQVKLGNAWWDAAKAETGDAQKAFKIRAGHWYELALTGLSGLSRQHAAKRMDEIRELNPAGRINPADWTLWTFDGNSNIDTSAATIQFEGGTLSLANNTNLKDALLLVYQPFVSNKPFLATMEVKGQIHQIGLQSAARTAQGITAYATRDQQWHTVTLERLTDKTVIMKIDNNPVEVRLWRTGYDMEGKIAFWLLKDEAFTLRWFEVKPTAGN